MIFVDCCLQTSLESLTDSALMKPPAPASMNTNLELTFNKINLAQTNQLHLTIRQFPLAAIFSDFLECPYANLDIDLAEVLVKLLLLVLGHLFICFILVIRFSCSLHGFGFVTKSTFQSGVLDFSKSKEIDMRQRHGG